MYQLSKEELRKDKISRKEFNALKRHSIVCILDDLSNMHNIGVIIRTCEAFRIEKLIVSSKMDVLKSRKVLKSALSSWKWLPIYQTKRLEISLQNLKDDGYEIVSVELTNNAIDYTMAKQNKKVAFIFGNERRGICQEVLDISDSSVYIPMHGMANSINVSSAVGIVLSHAINIRKAKC